MVKRIALYEYAKNEVLVAVNEILTEITLPLKDCFKGEPLIGKILRVAC